MADARSLGDDSHSQRGYGRITDITISDSTPDIAALGAVKTIAGVLKRAAGPGGLVEAFVRIGAGLMLGSGFMGGAKRGALGFLGLLAAACVLLGVLSAGASATEAHSGHPVIWERAVSNITQTDATLEATIISDGLASTYEFFLETPPCPVVAPVSCGDLIPHPVLIATGSLPASPRGHEDRVSVDVAATGHSLVAGKWNEFYVLAVDSEGNPAESGFPGHPELGFGFPFQSAPGPLAPSEVAVKAAEFTAEGIDFKGELNPHGLPTDYYFQACLKGPRECPEIYSKFLGPITGDTRQEVSALSEGELASLITERRLVPGAVYEYELVSINGEGETRSPPMIFKVPEEEPEQTPPPVVESPPAPPVESTPPVVESLPAPPPVVESSAPAVETPPVQPAGESPPLMPTKALAPTFVRSPTESPRPPASRVTSRRAHKAEDSAKSCRRMRNGKDRACRKKKAKARSDGRARKAAEKKRRAAARLRGRVTDSHHRNG